MVASVNILSYCTSKFKLKFADDLKVLFQERAISLCYNKGDNKFVEVNRFMAERTECLCDGKLIGIETIYTVIDGMQINIEGKVEALRKRSRNKELFCPCGCGTNLILVAGEKQLREQHFRIDDDNYNSRCEYVAEGKVSVQSKIVLKCWLDDKLGASEIETRVPIYAVDDTSRKFEFSLLVRESGLAISYHYERASLSDEKLEILDSNSKDIRVIYIIDEKNSFDNGQYPERLMKVQRKQGYCLLLEVENSNYYLAKMKAVYYTKNAYEVWEEVKIAEGFLKDFTLDDKDIFFEDKNIKEKLEEAKNKFTEKYEQEVLAIERAKEELEKQRIRQEIEQKALEAEKLRKNEELKSLLEFASRKMPTDIDSNNSCQMVSVSSEKIRFEDFSRQDRQILDEVGNRWIKCKYCGMIATTDKFVTYGGRGNINMGICYECKKKPEVEEDMRNGLVPSNSMICPKCGGKLIERNGHYGKFIGCSNFPNCRFTKSI